MTILVLPSLLILLPISLLFFLLKYWAKRKAISIGLKLLLGTIFVIVGLLTSLYAMTISMKGMADKNIRCMTGAIVFIPFGLFVHLIGVPMLLILFKSKTLEVPRKA